jgi:hypothetical protein
MPIPTSKGFSTMISEIPEGIPLPTSISVSVTGTDVRVGSGSSNGSGLTCGYLL